MGIPYSRERSRLKQKLNVLCKIFVNDYSAIRIATLGIDLVDISFGLSFFFYFDCYVKKINLMQQF